MDELTDLINEIKETQDLLDNECGGLEGVIKETGISDSVLARINANGVNCYAISQLTQLHPTLQSNPLFNPGYYSQIPTNQNLSAINNAVLQMELTPGQAGKGVGYAALLGLGLVILYKAYRKVREVIRRLRGKVSGGTAGAEKVVSRYICNTQDVKDVTFKVSSALKKALDGNAVNALVEFYTKTAEAISKLGESSTATIPTAPTLEAINSSNAFSGTDTVKWSELKEALDKKIDKGATHLLAELDAAATKLKEDDEPSTTKREEAGKVIAAIRAELNKATAIETPLLAVVAKASDLLVKRTKLGDSIVGDLQSALTKVASKVKDEGLIAELKQEWDIFKKLPDSTRSLGSFSSKFSSLNDKLKSNHSAAYTELVKGGKLTEDNIKAVLGGAKTWYVIAQ